MPLPGHLRDNIWRTQPWKTVPTELNIAIGEKEKERSDRAVEAQIAKKISESERLHPPKEVKKKAPLSLYRWRFRNSVQLVILLIALAVGFQFFIYVLQASGPRMITVSRPPGVEGFLPIGALLGWKFFVTTGVWDKIHPAAMVILGFAGLLSIFLRKSFCGWFCPAGALSEWLWKLGRKIFGKNFQIPYYMDIPLRSLKYVLLGFFIWAVFSMSQSAIDAFLQSPYYKVSDVKMLFFFTRISTLTTVVLLILIFSSLVIRNSWCRYLCPYGALMGLFALISPTRVERNTGTCIACKRCSDVCPYHLAVASKELVRSPECNGCMDCTSVCPVKSTLELKTKGFPRYIWSPLRLGVVVLGLFAVFMYTAKITGHWKSSVPETEFRMRLKEINSPAYTHPGIRRK
jgi:NAD-dependent dihydropyrimidine dehydrogenase PreA subunit